MKFSAQAMSQCRQRLARKVQSIGTVATWMTLIRIQTWIIAAIGDIVERLEGVSKYLGVAWCFRGEMRSK